MSMDGPRLFVFQSHGSGSARPTIAKKGQPSNLVDWKSRYVRHVRCARSGAFCLQAGAAASTFVRSNRHCPARRGSRFMAHAAVAPAVKPSLDMGLRLRLSVMMFL